MKFGWPRLRAQEVVLLHGVNLRAISITALFGFAQPARVAFSRVRVGAPRGGTSSAAITRTGPTASAAPCPRRHARCSLRAQRGRLFRTKVMTPMMARVPMPVVEVRLANGHRYRAWPAEWRLCQGPNGTSGSVLLAEGPGVYVLVDCSEIVGFRPVLPARFAPPHHQLEARNFHASGTARRARDARDPRG